MDEDPAATLHRLTKHGTYDSERAERLVRFHPLDPTNRPAPFRRWIGPAVEPLPVTEVPMGPRAVDVLSGKTGPERDALDVEALARLLFLAGGVTRTLHRGGEGPTYFRAAMSAGNLHPVEAYVVAGDVRGLDPGVHHFAPLEVGLTSLRAGDHRGVLRVAAAEPRVANAPATIVLTGLPWRTGWKYGERGWRHLYWDAGTMLANLLVAADALGIRARVLLGFVDRLVEGLVGADGSSELALALVVLGCGESGDAGTAAVEPGAPGPLEVEAEPLARAPIEFPLATAAQVAGALGRPDEVEAWRDLGSTLGRPADAELVPPGGGSDETIDAVIRRRGSTRVMRHETAPRELLTWGVSAGARPVPGDWARPDRTLLEHDVSVHAVEDFTPGAYRFQAGGEFEQLRTGDRATTREVASRLCLDQPLGGDSVFTAFHAAELEPILDTLGSRGYRAAQLEAGVAAGRLALAAFALGAGATGLTFYDDAVSAFFRTTAAPMLVTAVGFPDYRSAPGGPPRRPVELGHYDDLMHRLSVGLQRARRA